LKYSGGLTEEAKPFGACSRVCAATAAIRVELSARR